MSWLNELGYDVASLLPDLTSPSGDSHPLQSTTVGLPFGRERMIPVMTSFDCTFTRTLAGFRRLSAIPQSQIVATDNDDNECNNGCQSLSLLPQVFGRGVVLSNRDGKVSVSVVESANEKLALLATTLLNNSDAVGLRFTVHGRDMHYFVKRQLEQATEDINELSLQRESTIHGLTVSIHTHHDIPNVVRFVDIHLVRNHTAVNLRYGTTVAQERDRILHHALLRATEGAWVIERELVQSGKLLINSWSKMEREELLSRGSVSGMRAEYIRSLLEFPELADDPRNVRFVSSRN